MIKLFRISPFRLALAYVGLSIVVLALFAAPLWYAWQVNLSTFKEYVRDDDARRMADLLVKQGVNGLIIEIESRIKNIRDDEIIVLADASKNRLAGNLRIWPPEVPDTAGMYGVALDLGSSNFRFVGAHFVLPGGYHLLMGRESARFQSLVDFFWYGISSALGVALVMGAGVGWLIRRALLAEVNEISSTASAIVKGDTSRHLTRYDKSSELDTLAQTVNGMLEQLARQNSQLEAEVAVRRQAEQALRRTHDDLERLVAQRTEQLQNTNESLRRSEAYLAEAQQLAHVGSFGIRVQSRELVFSEETMRISAFEAGTRPTLEDALARVHPEDRPRIQALLEKGLREGSLLEYEHRFLLPDGSIRHVHVVAHTIQGGSNAAEFVGAVMDVTERKRAQEEHARLEQRLRQAEKMEAVGRLAGSVAHDFNNVVSGILAYGEMLLEETPESSRLHRHAQNVLAAANRGRALVEQILVYSRSQRGKRVQVDIVGVVFETLELVRGSLPFDIRLDASIPELPLVVLGDATQLHQVVMNLCSNAIHAMSSGGTLRVTLQAADVSAERTLSHGTLGLGRYARLTVEDDGSGMDEATLPRIFEPFFTTKEIGRGTGLGLSIVYTIVTDSGGAIDVKSAVKQGSMFEIYLPLVGTAPHDPPPSHP